MAVGLPTPSSNAPVTTFSIDRDRRDIDVSRQIARYIPDDSPWTVILMRARKRKTQTVEFHSYDEEPGAWWTQVTSAVTASDTDIPVLDATIFRAKDVIKVPKTGEIMFVTASNEATNTISVIRAYAGEPAQDIPADTWIVRIGNAMEQNSRAPDERIVQPVKFTNYCQIFRTPFSQSDTSEAEALKTSESERVRLRRLKALEHRMDIERALIWGRRKEDLVNRRYLTGGLDQFITTNVYDCQGELTEDKFEDMCATVFSLGPGRRIFLASHYVLAQINKWARDKIETRSGEETYGIRLRMYRSFHGDVYLVPSRTFQHDYAGMAFFLNMDQIEYRVLRDTRLWTNTQENDRDGWRDEYITEAGLHVRLEKTHMKVLNCLPS